MHAPTRAAVGTLILVLAVTVGACSGTTSASSRASSSGGSSSSSAGQAADPNAPESNPSGDIPDNQVYVAYVDPSGPFTVKVPEGWSRTDAGGVVELTDKLNSIRLEVVAAAVAPTPASAASTEVPAIKAAAKGYEEGKVTTVNRAAGQAVLITYRADSAPDPVTGKVIHLDVERYEFWKAGKEAVLTLSGPVGADNVDPWNTITSSFGWQ